MYKLTFDHTSKQTLTAVLINDKVLGDYLIKEESGADEQNHLLSCVEVFLANFENFTIPLVGKELALTDFSFRTKINIAWQVGRNIAHQPPSKLVNTLKMQCMLEKKKSIFLEKLYKVNHFAEDEATILMYAVIHALIL